MTRDARADSGVCIPATGTPWPVRPVAAALDLEIPGFLKCTAAAS